METMERRREIQKKIFFIAISLDWNKDTLPFSNFRLKNYAKNYSIIIF